MKFTRKREIILECERRVTIRFNDNSNEIFCAGCQTIVRFVTVDEASLLTRMTAREIFRLVENGQIHFKETVDGKLFVCLTSVKNVPNKHSD